MVERLHRRLKDALRAHCSGLNWADHLPWVLLGLRTAPREDTGLSPAQAVLGCNLALPADRPDAQPPEWPLQEELETLRATREAASGPRPATTPQRTSAPLKPSPMRSAPPTASWSAETATCHHWRPSTTGHIRCCDARPAFSPSGWESETKQSTCSG